VPTSRRALVTTALTSMAATAVAGLLRPDSAAAAPTPGRPEPQTPPAPTTEAALATRVRVGAYVHLAGHPNADPVAPADLATLEAAVGRRFDLVHYFFTWGRPFAQALNANADGRALTLSMKPDGSLVHDIAAGRQDPYIDQFTRDARDCGKEIYLRFGHEMNGQWMSYSAGSTGGPTADQFVTAWQHLVTRVRAQGATNVRFVWCPNEADFPNITGNHLEDYWPGEDYVDVAAFDAYNWSNQQPARGDGSWRTFDQLVAGPYERITRFTSRPIWLGEFGTTEAVPGVDPAGATKGDWFRAMFATSNYPRLQAILYFSEDDQRDTQRDWRLDTSTGSLNGFHDGWTAGTASGAGRLSVTAPLTVSPGVSAKPPAQAASFAVTNTGGDPLSIRRLLVGTRTAGGANVDFPSPPPMILQPGQSYQYTAHRTLTPGTYTAWPAYHDGHTWIELDRHLTFTTTTP